MEILAHLEGKPVRVGHYLHSLDGIKYLVVGASSHRDYDLTLMQVIDPDVSRIITGPSQWATNTHWQGLQVLFWEPRSPDQIAEIAAWEKAEEYDVQFNKRRDWLANLTDPDAYMVD